MGSGSDFGFGSGSGSGCGSGPRFGSGIWVCRTDLYLEYFGGGEASFPSAIMNAYPSNHKNCAIGIVVAMLDVSWYKYEQAGTKMSCLVLLGIIMRERGRGEEKRDRQTDTQTDARETHDRTPPSSGVKSHLNFVKAHAPHKTSSRHIVFPPHTRSDSPLTRPRAANSSLAIPFGVNLKLEFWSSR